MIDRDTHELLTRWLEHGRLTQAKTEIFSKFHVSLILCCINKSLRHCLLSRLVYLISSQRRTHIGVVRVDPALCSSHSVNSPPRRRMKSMKPITEHRIVRTDI